MLQKEKLCIESQGENYYFHLVDNMQTFFMWNILFKSALNKQ